MEFSRWRLTCHHKGNIICHLESCYPYLLNFKTDYVPKSGWRLHVCCPSPSSSGSTLPISHSTLQIFRKIQLLFLPSQSDAHGCCLHHNGAPDLTFNQPKFWLSACQVPRRTLLFKKNKSLLLITIGLPPTKRLSLGQFKSPGYINYLLLLC